VQALVAAILNREEVEDVKSGAGGGAAKAAGAEHPRLQEFRAGITFCACKKYIILGHMRCARGR
jgi:hypothetical protein